MGDSVSSRASRGPLRRGLELVVVMSLITSVSPNVASAALSAPRLHLRSLDQLPTPLPFPYQLGSDEVATNAAVNAAFDRAKRNQTRVLVDLGGNWCGWCRILASVMDLPEARPFIAAHFEVVNVDVTSKKGPPDRNIQILRRFNLSQDIAFPWLVVADANGTVLTSSYEITDERHQTPQAMMNWLAQWAKEVPSDLHR